MNMKKILEQAQKMQQEIQKKQQELEAKVFEVEKQGVLIKMNGKKEIISLEINEILMDPEDKETLQDLIILATNEVISIIENEFKKIMPPAPGGGQGYPF